jgi:hypothetical protein
MKRNVFYATFVPRPDAEGSDFCSSSNIAMFDNEQYFTELPSAEIFAAAAVFGSSAGA